MLKLLQNQCKPFETATVYLTKMEGDGLLFMDGEWQEMPGFVLVEGKYAIQNTGKGKLVVYLDFVLDA